jgi:predicted Zn finger-like uncharacterized protein
MILTCPECATSYFVDDLRIPRGGRMVRCSSCGARWRGGQETPDSEPESGSKAAQAEAGTSPVTATPDTDLEFVAGPATSPLRRPPPAPTKRPVGLYVAAGIAVGLAAIAGAAVVLRHQVVAVLPSTAPLFAAIGLPVNTTGLVIEEVKSRAVLDAGRPALAVTGSIRNTRRAPVQAPPIRIRLLDRAGKPVATTLYRPLNARLPSGARRYFAVSLPAPPAELHDLEIGFEAGGTQTLPAGADAPSTAEARALSPGPPDAVTHHE